MAKSKKARRLDELAAQIRVCTRCPLHESRTHAVPGDGSYNARVMIIGEAPGREEDESGHPFVGSAGRYLDHVLEGTGLDRADFFITNTVKCRPPKNRTPKSIEVGTCTSNYLFEQIELINPRLVMLLGGVSAKAVLGAKSVGEFRGKALERDGRRYIVGYHPAVRFYREDLGEKVKEDFALLKRELKTVDGKETIEGKSKEAEGKSEHESVAGVKKFDAAKGARVVSARALKSKKLEGDLNVRVGGEVVPLTHLERVYWPEEGYTKGDLVSYYHEISRYILPYLEDRPLIMKRYPSGINGQSFHQHDIHQEVPDFMRTAALEVEDGGEHTVDYIVGSNEATLLYMANLGAIERHPWHSRVGDLEHPDWFVFDLDPSEGVEFATICDVALTTREVLARVGLESYAKTSGSRGIHVYVPVKPSYAYEQIAELAEQVATAVAREQPEVATVERSKRKRGARMIYVDHMQNARGKSVVAPYSVRPKPGATVSAPLEWREVERGRIETADFHIKNMPRRVERKGDLFKPVLKKRQKLEGVFERARELFESGGKRGRAAKA